MNLLTSVFGHGKPKERTTLIKIAQTVENNKLNRAAVEKI